MPPPKSAIQNNDTSNPRSPCRYIATQPESLIVIRRTSSPCCSRKLFGFTSVLVILVLGGIALFILTMLFALFALGKLDDKTGKCFVVGFTTTYAYEKYSGEGVYRAYVMDVVSNGTTLGNSTWVVAPWYPNRATASLDFYQLYPIGTNWTCLYDSNSLDLSDPGDFDIAIALTASWAVMLVIVMVAATIAIYWCATIPNCYPPCCRCRCCGLPEVQQHVETASQWWDKMKSHAGLMSQ